MPTVIDKSIRATRGIYKRINIYRKKDGTAYYAQQPQEQSDKLLLASCNPCYAYSEVNRINSK